MESRADGEVSFCTLEHMISVIRTSYGGLLARGGRFIDVGSGCGKPLFAAALLHDFDECLGIEILSSLHEVAEQLKSTWTRLLGHGDEDAHPYPDSHEMAHARQQARSTEIVLINGDATTMDWDGATLVLLASTCFSDELLATLAKKAVALQEGSFVITLSAPLESPELEVLQWEELKMEWGTCTVYLHQRRPATASRTQESLDRTAPPDCQEGTG